eukprot:TRINITY_DN1381_c0_g1_i1.p1 TRINITY_DN1381_c0_g1~~TRINITY_DN1381_c0_g1_i1.p1  ORF type:complete len:259 (+),score=42.34 TRINITY_DN1381_c0_g1_i1:83-859(+)
MDLSFDSESFPRSGINVERSDAMLIVEANHATSNTINLIFNPGFQVNNTAMDPRDINFSVQFDDGTKPSIISSAVDAKGFVVSIGIRDMSQTAHTLTVSTKSGRGQMRKYGILRLGDEENSYKQMCWKLASGHRDDLKAWDDFKAVLALFVDHLFSEKNEHRNRPRHPIEMGCFAQYCGANSTVSKQKAIELVSWIYLVRIKTHPYIIDKWRKSEVHGFYSRSQSEKLLHNEPDGTYVIRFRYYSTRLRCGLEVEIID